MAEERGLIAADSRWGGRLRVALVVLAIVLAGQMLTQGVSDDLAEHDPATAVLWRSDSAEALAQLALRQLASQTLNHAAALARRSLNLDPLNAAALSALGLTLDRAGRADQANRAMSVAGAQGWRDPVTQIWLMQHRLAA